MQESCLALFSNPQLSHHVTQCNVRLMGVFHSVADRQQCLGMFDEVALMH
jgi:hypothetical protein